jgi:glycosyltransferase involved in cell wall biosynthesis
VTKPVPVPDGQHDGAHPGPEANDGRKRIAVFLPGLYGGGAERTMLSLAEGIAGRGYRVDLVLAEAEGPYLHEVPETVQVIDLSGGRRARWGRTMSRIPSLATYFRRERPDALLSALTRSNLAAIWARRLARSTSRVVVNEQAQLTAGLAEAGRVVAILTRSLVRAFYPGADRVVGVSQGVVDDLVALGLPAPLTKVIYNPAVTPDLEWKMREPLEHPWFQPEEPPTILAVGRLATQKDYGTLLEAFAQLRRNRHARLMILGEGPERATLEAHVRGLGMEDDVSMPGFVANPYPYMARAAVFVMSSRWEGLPTVLIEALRCGTPVVSTDCPSGPREILKGGERGRLVPMSDASALGAALAAALDGDIPHPDEASWQPYALDTIVDQYLGLLLGD